MLTVKLSVVLFNSSSKVVECKLSLYLGLQAVPTSSDHTWDTIMWGRFQEVVDSVQWETILYIRRNSQYCPTSHNLPLENSLPDSLCTQLSSLVSVSTGVSVHLSASKASPTQPMVLTQLNLRKFYKLLALPQNAQNNHGLSLKYNEKVLY